MYFKSSHYFHNYIHLKCIAQIKAQIASEEMSHRSTWGRFMNWHGGKGRNSACNMAQEICNWVSKDVVKAIGLNKTQKAMEMRASKAAAGVQQIVKRLNKVLDVKRVSQAHIHKSVTKDEVIMVQDLRKIKPFEIKPFERKP